MKKFNCSIGNKYDKRGNEVVNWGKFRYGFFGLFNPVLWLKDIFSIFNVRKLVLYAIILISVGGYFYWQGRQSRPVKINLGYEEAVEIQVPKSNLRLYKPKNSQDLYWIDKKGNKTHVKLADIPSLQKKLRPYGIVFEPYMTGGVGIGETVDKELGIGAHFYKFYLTRLGGHLTNRGVYLGAGYKLSGLGLNNTSLNVGYGQGWSGDKRMYFGLAINF